MNTTTTLTFIKQLVIGLSIAMFGYLFATAPAMVGAADLSDIACEGLGEALGDAGCAGGQPTEINDTIQLAVNILSVVVGIIAVIMIIIAAIRYVTSGGDPGSTKGAKDTIVYALVGIVIVSAAQIVVRYVVGGIFG